ncbi:MAG: hypothetical protein GF334_02485 [Candidatus Altiarchaeales archaeon]|nr:hypothetical protein [Candidatus Altiarchaeales archaeon]
MASRLRQELENRAGFEECEFVVPHVLLPPRFRKQAAGRNMILHMDLDYVVHVRWEGERLLPHCELTPGEIRRLLKDVNRKMTQYRQDLGVLGRFFDSHAEPPFWDPRENYRQPEESEKQAVSSEERGKEITASLSREEGGESQVMLDFDW